MSLLSLLQECILYPDRPFLLNGQNSLTPRDILESAAHDLSLLQKGDVVGLVGGFDAPSVRLLLHLLDNGMIVAPLTEEAGALEPFFAAGLMDVTIRNGVATRIRDQQANHPILDALRAEGEGGIIFFSSGTTGTPKAGVHAASSFMQRYLTPRPALKTLAFLLFDHIGGINTLLHMLFNNGQIVVPTSRSPESVLRAVQEYAVELLPASPTFLRMLLFSGFLEAKALPELRLVTYGTERMDQVTLDGLCATLPHVEFRQTYGLSELGILRVKSRANNSLFMRIGGEGVEIRVEDEKISSSSIPVKMLYIRAKNAMRGYLNAPNPFDSEGWYRTGDIVECDGEWLRITGREGDVINVGGIKVMPAEIENVALTFPGILLAKAIARENPITGQHVELFCQLEDLPPESTPTGREGRPSFENLSCGTGSAAPAISLAEGAGLQGGLCPPLQTSPIGSTPTGRGGRPSFENLSCGTGSAAPAISLAEGAGLQGGLCPPLQTSPIGSAPTGRGGRPSFEKELKRYLAARLPAYAVPQRIRFEMVPVNHRFKRG